MASAEKWSGRSLRDRAAWDPAGARLSGSPPLVVVFFMVFHQAKRWALTEVPREVTGTRRGSTVSAEQCWAEELCRTVGGTFRLPPRTMSCDDLDGPRGGLGVGINIYLLCTRDFLGHISWNPHNFLRGSKCHLHFVG